jgi:PhzF family phenazine biosynthesis protein
MSAAPRAERMLRIFQVDAFTERPFAGNPAGVVLDADGLSEPQMQAIATEMSVAETAFVSSAGPGNAHARLRWFTPANEVTYCGHATVATVHAMVELRRLSPGERIVFDTLGGMLGVEVEDRPAGPIMWLEPALPRLEHFAGTLDEIAAAAGLRPGSLADWAGPALTPERDLLVAVSGLGPLRALAPDMSALGRVAAASRIRGLCAVSRETVDPASSTHCRFFAPHYGIPEDIVTGSVHSSVGLWLFDAGLLTSSAERAAFTAEQGDGLGRPGRLLVEVQTAGGRPSRVRVGGRAVTVLEGRIARP